MGRKKGGRNADTPLKDQETLSRVLKDGKTHQEIANELGIDKSTVSLRLQRAINNERIQEVLQRSIDRNAMMLGKVDHKFNQILDSNDPLHFGHQIKIGEGIYKTFGVWKQEPIIQINNFTPITIKTHEGTETIDVGAPSETEPRLQKPE